VALKVLAPHLTWDPRFVERFRREARAVARLRHPNIIVVHEIGEEAGQVYIAMEYLSGRTLAQTIADEGALPLEKTVAILDQVTSALDYAHGQGVIHRDIKPSNVMVEEGGQAKLLVTLMDFGLVKAMESSEGLTSVGTVLGSPEYMAPEQADFSRRDEISPATDRYALGVVAYQMLTGRVPFSGPTTAVLHAHVYEPPPDPQGIREELSGEVAQVLLKALAKEPQARYQSARALVAALQGAATAEEQAERREEQLAQDERRREQEHIAALYQEAVRLTRARQWQQALEKMQAIHDLDPEFADPDGVAARAREGIAEEEQEAQRQKMLDGLYAEAVRLLRVGQYEEALAQWENVRAQDPWYADRQNVRATARERLRALARVGEPGEAGTRQGEVPLWQRALSPLWLMPVGWAVGWLAGGILKDLGNCDDSCWFVWNEYGWGIVLAGAIGGLIAGLAMRRTRVLSQWKGAAIVALGWTIAWAIGWAIGWAVQEANSTAIYDAGMNIKLSFEDENAREVVYGVLTQWAQHWGFVGLVAGPIAGSIGCLVVGLVWRSMDAAVRWVHILTGAIVWPVSWAVAWAIGGLIGALGAKWERTGIRGIVIGLLASAILSGVVFYLLTRARPNTSPHR
jgi:tetratricopeptide (TPR) repeat protein